MANRPVTIRQILIMARDLISEEGWIQGRKRNENGFCIVGAFDFVEDKLLDKEIRLKVFEARQVFKKYNGISNGYMHIPLAVWNDSRDMTKRKVINAFNRAIYRKRIGGSNNDLGREAK